MRILFVGDTHGDRAVIRLAGEQAADLKADLIWQVGDFGIWPGTSWAENSAALAAEHAGCEWWFVDGNHDDHDRLDATPIDPDRGLRNIGGRRTKGLVWHVPRGSIHVLGGLSFLAMGGAPSIDGPHGAAWWRKVRGPHGNGWWRQETIQPHDLETAATNLAKHGPVDVMVTHDAPQLPPQIKNPHVWPEGQAHNDILANLVEQAQPQLLVHGHYHIAHATTRRRADGTKYKVRSLAADGERGSTWLLDTDA